MLKKCKLEELRGANYHDLEYLVYRMELTYHENMEILDIKYFPSERKGYTLPSAIYQIGDINEMLEYLLPDFVKVSITIDDIRLKSNLDIIQNLIFNKTSFFYTILGFTQSHSGVLMISKDSFTYYQVHIKAMNRSI